MPDGNGKLQQRLMVGMTSLVVSGIIALIVMYRSVGIAEDNIEDLKSDQKAQAEMVTRGLNKIGDKLDDIADSISDQAVEGAKYHHEHKAD